MIYIDSILVTISFPVLPNTPNTSGEKAFGFLPYLEDQDNKLCKDGFGMINIYKKIKTNSFYKISFL